MNRWIALALFCHFFCLSLCAQTPDDRSSMCWRGRPKERCSTIVLTDYGVYYIPVSADYRPQLRLVADWGLLFNVGEHDALGASIFASFDHDDISLGPEVRYRRWFGDEQSIDLAIGTPLVGGDYRAGLYGLLKWNPVHWFGIAVRPEWRQRQQPVFIYIDPFGNAIQPPGEPDGFHLSTGVEFGWWPGLGLAAASGVAVLVLAAALSGLH